MEQQFVEQNWQAPPPPANAPALEGETMSLGQTLVNIFFEPSRTFSALRVRPRFLVAAVICVLMFLAFQLAFIQKVGYATIVNAQINQNPRAAEMSNAQKDAAMEMANNPALKALTYASPIIGLTLIFGIGALIYWGASAAFGGSANFWQSLSLFVYSALPMYVISMLVNLLVLLLKDASEIDPITAQRGLASANLGLLVDAKAQPLLATMLGSFDLFQFYGMFLAAIGFQKTAKLSAASAWTIVIGLWAILLILRIAYSLMTGVAA